MIQFMMYSLNLIFLFFIGFNSFSSTESTIFIGNVTSRSFELVVNKSAVKKLSTVNLSHKFFESTITDNYQFKIYFNRTILIFPCLKPETRYSIYLKLDKAEKTQINVTTLSDSNQRNDKSGECSYNSWLLNFTSEFDRQTIIVSPKNTTQYKPIVICGNTQGSAFPISTQGTTCLISKKEIPNLTFQSTSDDQHYLDLFLIVRTPDKKPSINSVRISSSTSNSVNLSVNCSYHSLWKYLIINYSVADFIGRPQFLDTKSISTVKMDPSKSHHVIDNLHAGIKYNIIVCVYNRDENTCYSPVSYWTEDKTPLLVDSFKIDAIGKAGVRLKWNGGITMGSETWTGVVLEYLVVVDELRRCYLLSCRECHHYQLENLDKNINIKTYCDGMIKKAILNVNEMEHSVTIRDLRPFTLYNFSLYSINRANVSPVSRITGRTREDISGPPSNVKCSGNPESVSIRWDRPRSPNGIITGYRIMLGSDFVSYHLNDSTRQYKIDGLQSCSLYTIKVHAVNRAGIGETAVCLSTTTAKMYFKSCRDLAAGRDTDINDVYEIFPTHGPLMKVFCQNEWIVIQRRINGQESFARNWNEYKFGFGDLKKEFWIGNEYLHILTSIYNMKIRFELWDEEQNYRYAQYNTFIVDSEINKYKLTIDDYHGTAGDAMKDHNEYSFSTKDRDNDYNFNIDCSQKYCGSGGWWFHNCSTANLNGEYLTPGRNSTAGVTWDMWREGISMKKSVIKISIKY